MTPFENRDVPEDLCIQSGRVCCGPDEIHVWRIALDLSQSELHALEAVLAREERLRASRFVTRELGNRWTASRGALRMILAAYSGSSAADIVFATDDCGKPRLEGVASPVFNLSHTGNVAFAAVALRDAVGIDAEVERADIDWLEIGRRYFAPAEVDEIAALPSGLRLRAGYACWTRKEAYLKALGMGLSSALDTFQVNVRPDDPPRLVHVAGDRDEPGRWTFADLSEPDLAVTLVVRKPRAAVRRFTFAIGEICSPPQRLKSAPNSDPQR